jgi:hypothetical protein
MKHKWQRSREVFDHRVTIGDGPQTIQVITNIVITKNINKKSFWMSHIIELF